jgi:hypothetical protein
MPDPKSGPTSKLVSQLLGDGAATQLLRPFLKRQPVERLQTRLRKHFPEQRSTIKKSHLRGSGVFSAIMVAAG